MVELGFPILTCSIEVIDLCEGSSRWQSMARRQLARCNQTDGALIQLAITARRNWISRPLFLLFPSKLTSADVPVYSADIQFVQH